MHFFEFFYKKYLFSKCFTQKLVFIRNISFVVKMMKKNRTHALALKEVTVRNKKELKSLRYPPANIYLCVLGNGAISSSRCLYMFTDHGKYIFNCGEGTQRLAHEHKMRLSRLEHIFVTHKSWDNLAGLLGLSLTIQEMGVPEITLHGPSNLESIYEYASSFAYMQALKIGTRSYRENTFKDEVMAVDYIPIFKPAKTEKSSYQPDNKFLGSEDEAMEQKSKRPCTGIEETSDMVIAFACKCHNKPGFLLIEKCVEMGVPPGPLLGELKSGKDVTLPSGKIVYSKDVVSEEQISPFFLVVECPSEDFLDSFVNEPKFLMYQDNAIDQSQIASLVVHFTPSKILKSAKYQNWINRFPSTTTHIIINLDNSTLNSMAIHRIQHKLNLLHPGIFKLLHEEEVTKDNLSGLPENVIQSETLDRFHLRPSKGFDRTASVSIQPECFIEEANSIENFKNSLETLQNNIQCFKSKTEDSIYPEITFLGTGSCIPSKARNVSGILVKVSECNYVVLDCGEGTCHQLIRTFGKEHYQILMEISYIFISHMHADHHLGLIHLLKLRKKYFLDSNKEEKIVTIVGPRKLNLWLKNVLSAYEEVIPLFRFIECSSLEYQTPTSVIEELDELKENNEITILTVAVNHCTDAYGVVLKPFLQNWKLVYSGDTMPCENLVTAGMDCSILIHEATMEDELSADAIIKKHSTTSEAIQIGEQMNSKYTILTHFSQRYAKIPIFNENFHNHIGCSFDNMTVSSNELYILPLLIPVLKCLFAEDIEDLQAKNSKRQQKIELCKKLNI